MGDVRNVAMGCGAQLTEEVANELQIVCGLIIERICLTVPQQEPDVDDDRHKESKLVRWEQEQPRRANHAPPL